MIEIVIHYVCGCYPYLKGGVPRFDNLIKTVYPNRIFVKAQEEKHILLELINNYCDKQLLIITDNQFAVDIPTHIPLIIVHHGIARTHSERDPLWTGETRDLCINGQDEMLEKRSSHNTIFIAISQFCIDEFTRHYGEKYTKFRIFSLPTPYDKFGFYSESKSTNSKPVIIGDWRDTNKGSHLVAELQIRFPEYEFRQLKTTDTNDMVEHNKQIENSYHSADFYLSFSKSEGNSFSILDAFYYDLCVIGTNVGYLYKLENDLAYIYDWELTNNIDKITEIVRDAVSKSIKNKSKIDTLLSLENWIINFLKICNDFVSIKTNILYPINNDIFWQYPVITEQYFCQKHLTKILDDEVIICAPWATMIDKKIIEEKTLNQISRIGQSYKKTISTCCQHIHFKKLFPLFKNMAITKLYVSHANETRIENIQIESIPLYPVNVFDSNRLCGLKIHNENRKYLFSFSGCHMDHYISDIRKKILSWESSDDIFIKNTNTWHFQNDVYKNQVLKQDITTSEKDLQDINTREYNEVLLNSIFSLCPVGAGPNTIRLWESLGFGSIPIIIGNEYRLPFPDIPHISLDYNSNHLKDTKSLKKYLLTKVHDIDILKKRGYEIIDYITQYGLIYNVDEFNNIVKTQINNKLISNKNGIHLILQTYPEKNHDRLNELILCIVSNLQNKHVSSVINLCEGDSDHYLPDIIRDHAKYICHKGYSRLTYKTAFEYSNEHLEGEIVGLINTDIMLAEDFRLDDLQKILTERVVIANARHEMNLSNGYIYLDENFKRMFHANTQDAWFYKSQIHVDNTNFELGLVGCDNAIAHRLQAAGYIVYNMPERFKIIHVDSLRGKNSDNFGGFHKQNESKNKIVNKHPENDGQLLVPNYDMIKTMSVDKILESLGYTEEEKVWLVTRAMSEKLKIKN